MSLVGLHRTWRVGAEWPVNAHTGLPLRHRRTRTQRIESKAGREIVGDTRKHQAGNTHVRTSQQ
jgi:hypothetical protein